MKKNIGEEKNGQEQKNYKIYTIASYKYVIMSFKYLNLPNCFLYICNMQFKCLNLPNCFLYIFNMQFKWLNLDLLLINLIFICYPACLSYPGELTEIKRLSIDPQIKSAHIGYQDQAHKFQALNSYVDCPFNTKLIMFPSLNVVLKPRF